VAELMCEVTGEKKWSDQPFVRAPVRCRLGFHDFCAMPVSSGLRERGVRERKACTRCGRVWMWKYTNIMFGGGNYPNGFIHPDNVGKAGY
jgi:hypothetical protein